MNRIVSGAQTGADRAALDVAMAWGLETGGWVPRGRLAEDGVVPDRYRGLRETATADSRERTSNNVRDSDGTLIVSRGTLTGGSLFTQEVALRLGRPLLHADLAVMAMPAAIARVVDWVRDHAVNTLNVAGPRASGDADIYLLTSVLLGGVLARLITDTPQPGETLE